MTWPGIGVINHKWLALPAQTEKPPPHGWWNAWPSLQGKNALAAGNISPAAMDALREQLESDDLPDVWVLELSSFQLHWTKRLRFDASTVLNITQDHLDWHPDLQEYAQDKFRIFPRMLCVC